MEATTAPGLQVLAALKAARDFGLEPEEAADIARRYDPAVFGFDRFVEALARAVTDCARATPRA
jgi:hypothetical protein